MSEKAPALQLSRETLRQLDNDKLVHVGGGACDTTSWTTELVPDPATHHRC